MKARNLPSDEVLVGDLRKRGGGEGYSREMR